MISLTKRPRFAASSAWGGVAGLLLLVAAGPVAAQSPSPGVDVVSVPNSTLSLASGWSTSCPGPAIFVPFDAGVPFDSVLLADYCWVQSDGAPDQTWLDALIAAGAEPLEVHSERALAVRVANGGCAALADVPGTRAACAIAPSHKPAWTLADALGPVVPARLLHADDGLLHVVAIMQRGEDPRNYEGEAALQPCVLASDSRAPGGTGPIGWPAALDLGIDPTCPQRVDAIRWLADLEASAALVVGLRGSNPIDDSVWYTQTSIVPPPPPAPKYDLNAKLFAHGVSGVGQVIGVGDTGLDNDSCFFTYGTDIDDATLVLPGQPGSPFYPPFAVNSATPHPRWKRGNKVIAYYMPGAGTVSAPAPYGSNHHGTWITGAAAGDSREVLAARAGMAEDDPFEAEGLGNPYGTTIEHHQAGDGMAPGAQLIIQETPLPNQGLPPISFVDWITQSYDTEPHPCAYTTAEGEWLGEMGDGNPWNPAAPVPAGGRGYGELAMAADERMYSLRDLLISLPAGNSGPYYNSIAEVSACKNCIVVGGTAHAIGPTGIAQSMYSSTPPPALFGNSGHGPGFLYQLKPDVLVPAQDLVLPESNYPDVETGIGDGRFACALTPSPLSGTSAAAPSVAGLAADIRQYFADGYYPSGAATPSNGFVPTNALLKAILINSTRNLLGIEPPTGPPNVGFTGDSGAPHDDRPTFGQGWGKVVLDDTLFFAGDPTNVAPSGLERARLYVLNDVPNGLESTADINDSRARILDTFRPAIREAPVASRLYEGKIRVYEASELHVTLAWSDVPGAPGSADPGNPCVAAGIGQLPLVHDLDLEVALEEPAPGAYKVWRPQPGSECVTNPADPPIRSRDAPNRLWFNGYSRLSTLTCPNTTCLCTGLESALLQDFVTPCDFAGRDRHNTVENIFIHDAEPGIYVIRVIGYSVPSAGRTTFAKPNFVDTDNDENGDVISDRSQGYALVASGSIVTEKGQLRFDKARYACGETAKVILETRTPLAPGPDPTLPNETDVQISITTSAGDCDSFWLLFTAAAGQDGLWRYETPPIPIAALTWPAPTLGCTDAAGDGDGIVMIDADGSIEAGPDVVAPIQGTYIVPNIARARVWCRDVGLLDVTVDDPCAPLATRDGQLSPEEPALIEVRLNNPGVPVGALSGVLTADSSAVIVTAPAVFIEEPTGTFTGRFDVWVDDAILSRCTGLQLDPPLGFTVELTGEDGFRDRVSFQIPLNCAPVGGIALYRPNEVEPSSVRVRKTGQNSVDLRLDWAASLDASVYNVWEGDLALLHRGAYSHVVPDLTPALLVGYCDIPAPTSTLADVAALDVPNHYYLVSAETEPPCGTPFSYDGPAGYTGPGLDGTPVPSEIPTGRRLDPLCQ